MAVKRPHCFNKAPSATCSETVSLASRKANLLGKSPVHWQTGKWQRQTATKWPRPAGMIWWSRPAQVWS